MLQRPQFSRLQKLVIPFMEVTDSLLMEIAEASPTLEELESKSEAQHKLSSKMMRKLPFIFPLLTKVCVEMRNTKDVIRLVEDMGERLAELTVKVHYDMEAGFTDDDFIFVARHCPNLRSFTHSSRRGFYHISNMEHNEERQRHTQMTEMGLAALVEGAQSLRISRWLALVNS
jgi:hypothetical protein